MRKLIPAVALAAVFGCGPEVREGMVVGKDFVPEHADTYFMPTYVGDTLILMPQTNHYGDDWRLTLRAGEATGSTSVDRATYEAVNLGDHIDLGAK